MKPNANSYIVEFILLTKQNCFFIEIKEGKKMSNEKNIITKKKGVQTNSVFDQIINYREVISTAMDQPPQLVEEHLTMLLNNSDPNIQKFAQDNLTLIKKDIRLFYD